MKFKMFSMLLAVTILAISCKKQVTPECLKAKLVRITCAGKVFQVLNNNAKGEDGWRDMYTNEKYDNVFAVSNPCNIPSEYKVGDVVYVTLDNSTSANCIVCALYDAPPTVVYGVKTIGSLPCNERVAK